ncbi:hypothetical protein C8A05DRAFT_35231 [Staphylotrichum tortipilum]|uniref:Protein kinase domain-containing protein n=1 Tax=Staphylotrichum tortipilum TaxID=2831512 RepID=A0AAN6MI42_9PEZI|nr:hypothetical protein C8A05DRAFT_35231 [Staphylotrichum longicolle]
MDSHEVASKARSRIATPKLSMWIDKIKINILDTPSPYQPFRPGEVLFLRLAASEREMLRAAAADDDGRSPPRDTGWSGEQIREVAVLLFLRWSFAQHVLREILYQLGEVETDDLSNSDSKSNSNSVTLSNLPSIWTPAETFGDSLVDNPPDMNWLVDWGDGFADNLASNLDGSVPHSSEVAGEQIPQSATLVGSFIKGLETRHDNFLPWDRRHERVTELREDPDNRQWWAVFEDYFRTFARALDSDSPKLITIGPHPEDADIWWDMASQVIKKRETMRRWPGVNEAAFRATAISRGEEYSTWSTDSDNPTWYKKFLAASARQTAHKYEEEWVDRMNAVVDAANVWDVWTLLRMIKCEAASRELEKTMGPGGHDLLRQVLMQGPRDMTNPCPIWNQRSRDFAELACYCSSMYQFHDVTGKTIVAELLESVGLENTSDWDLVSLGGTQQTWAFPDSFWNHGHYRHSLYLTDDLNKRYCEAGCGFPGQTALHGGEVVFARRKLEDSALVKNLDRFWVDWNDSRGLASACLYFNLKLENREIEAAGRGMLRNIMGPEYHPRYSDYTYLIDPHGLDFPSAKDVCWPQGGFMTASVTCKKARRYTQDGSVAYERGMAVVEVMAEAEDEDSSSRLETFRRNLTACYDLVAGNRIKNMAHFYGFTTAPVWFGHGDCSYPDKPSLTRLHYIKPGLTSQPAWALVFEGSEHGSLIRSMSDCSFSMTERATWLTILTFLYEIGAAIREIHKLVGRPYCHIHPDNIYLRARTSPPLCARASSTPAGEYEPVLSAPSSPLPDLRRIGMPELSRLEAEKHTESTDAYMFARYVMKLIAASAAGLWTGHEGVEGPEGERVVVFYVEILAGLEAILRGDLEVDLWEGVGLGGKGTGKGTSALPPAAGRNGELGRVQAMDCFLALAKRVADGSLVLDGVFPVQEASGWYEFETAFPRVWKLLNKHGNDRDMKMSRCWFNRDSVLLYWMMRPAGWSWDEDEPSSGSEWDGLAGGGESIWNGSNRSGPKSETTVE